jgi:polyisoprenoid-binding protein YceI
MKASHATSQAQFTISPNDKITNFENLTFTIPVKSLKSQSKVMDNNTYKALNVSEHPNISFTLTSANVTSDDGSVYTIKGRGKLTIAGITRETDVVASGKYHPADKSLTLTGSKKFKMTDYKVTPPTVMMGTVKTGDDITVAYNLKFVK